LVVALTSVVLVVALIYFIFAANSMRDRIPVPPSTIPIAMAAAALLGVFMLFRAVQQFRQFWRVLRGKETDDS
jgi:hypothetical protein